MCRLYGKGKDAYVRLCYRKGQRRGEHINFDAAVLMGWHSYGCVKINHQKYQSTVNNNDVQQRGYNARWDGKPLTSNPHQKPELKNAWQAGWAIADNEIITASKGIK